MDVDEYPAPLQSQQVFQALIKLEGVLNYN
jgi:hypothetical protein